MKKFKVGLAFCLIMVIIILASCNTTSIKEQVHNEFIYNGLSTDWLTSDGKYLYSQIQNPTHMIELQSGKSYELIRDPFFKGNEYANPIIYIFADEEYCYYLLKNKKSSYQIIRQNNETFEKHILYEKIFFLEQQDIFLGAIKTSSPDINEYYYANTPNRFAVFENILFLFYDDSIQAISLETKKEKTILSKGLYNGNYSYYNGILYFVDSTYDIYSYKIYTDELEHIKNYKAQTLLITSFGIYFSAANDKGRLHYIDFDYQNEQVLTDITVSAMDFNEQYIYYISEGTSDIYRTNKNGSENKKVKELTGVFDIYCIKEKKLNILVYVGENGEFSVKEQPLY